MIENPPLITNAISPAEIIQILSTPKYREFLFKIEKEYPRYMTYCYTELTKGSKPIYKIICNDKELLEHYTSEFCTTNSLETLPRFKVNYYPRKEELYDNPVTISCETGEIVE